jgi:hypothetical protein
MNDNNEQPLPDSRQSKKVYKQPDLQVYGNLKEITQNVGDKGTLDGGSGAANRTHS